MLSEGASLKIHDPKVSKEQIAIDLGTPPFEDLKKNKELVKQYKNKKWENSPLKNHFF